MPIRNVRVDWPEKLECKSGSRLKMEFEELSGCTYKVVDLSEFLSTGVQMHHVVFVAVIKLCPGIGKYYDNS